MKGAGKKVKSDERVNMRVPQEVKDEMMREAKKAGLNLTEYIIQCHEDNVLGKNEDIKKVRELLENKKGE